MAHGHSHGGSKKKPNNQNGHKKDEDSVEIGDSEHLCADERIGIEDNHDHSHTVGLSTSNEDQTTNEETKSKKEKKKGCEKIFENLIKKNSLNF
jgi:hypothetical protein